MKKTIKKCLVKALALAVVASMTCSYAFAASFDDLQNAIDGNTSAGVHITDSDRDDHYGYGDKNEDTGNYGVESWKGDDGSHNVQINESVSKEDGEKDSVVVGGSSSDSSDTSGGNTNVNIDLNGNDIQSGDSDTVIKVENGADLTLKDTSSDNTENQGTVEGNVTVSGDGTLNLEGGNISNEDGTGITVDDGTLNMSGGSVSNNGDSGVVVNKDGEFNMSGGTISGNTATDKVHNDVNWEISDDKREDHNMGGGVLVNGGEFNMSGGEITNNKTENTDDRYSSSGNTVGQGGGVAVKDGGEFNLSGGTISNNEAGEGGGVFIDQNGKFNMNDANGTTSGAKVDGNIAHEGEGGGIYIKGTGKIEAGEITNNVTYTKDDLGGGGIYVENSGTLDLLNAIITENYANSLGGGIAACVHGKTIMFSTNGAAVYGNEAAGNYLVPATDEQGNIIKDENGNTMYLVYGLTSNKKVDGQDAWKHLEGQDREDLVNGAQDIFSAGNANLQGDATTNESGKSGALIGVIMLGGDKANWQGWKINYETVVGGGWQTNGHVKLDENGKPVGFNYQKFSDQEMAVYADQLLGLTANPTQSAIDKALSQGKVIISGNKSMNTHGGGIANNGILRIGATDSEFEAQSPDLELNKKLENVEDREDAPALKDKEFSFELTDSTGKVVGTVENGADGKAQFVISSDTFAGAKDGDEFVFYVREQNNGVENVTYDETVYRVTIKISVQTQTSTIGNGKDEGNHTYTVTTATVKETVIEKVTLDENGNVISSEAAANGISFNNVYNKPEDPKEDPKDDPKEDPKEDPKDDPKDDPKEDPKEDPKDDPKEEPPTDIPEEDVPLADIPDEDIPLAEIPEEEVEIPDEDIPLADVPKTGDISLVWYLTTLLSACGLALLGLRRKDRG